VEDTGRGIPEPVRSRLFTSQVVSTKPGGTGLGTRIVAGVVRRHGGTIQVWSEEGCGTRFSVRLPLHQNQDDEQDPAAGAVPPAADSGRDAEAAAGRPIEVDAKPLSGGEGALAMGAARLPPGANP